MLKCKWCEQVFESIPTDATQIGKTLGNRRLYRFPDGSVHDLYSVGMGRPKRPKTKIDVPVPTPEMEIRTVAIFSEEEL